MWSNQWFLLTLAIIFEVAGTLCLKLSDGLSKFWLSVGVFVFYAICFTIFAFALKKLDMGVAYAIWAGVGVALITAIGILFLGEPLTTVKVISTGLIIAGVVGLHL